jgi:hypothetical protein
MVAECERYDIDSALAEEPTPQVPLRNRSVVRQNAGGCEINSLRDFLRQGPFAPQALPCFFTVLRKQQTGFLPWPPSPRLARQMRMNSGN